MAQEVVPDTTQARLLGAAGRVVRRDGVLGLTLEAVAREAGVSKGGLLYHYPSKEALVSGMLAAYLGAFEARVARRLRGGASYPHAFVQATLEELGDERLRAQHGALLAALAHHPQVLEDLRGAAQGWQRRLEEGGLDPARATVARLAVDGLYFAELLGAAAPQGPLRVEVERLLLDLATP